jgi:hypothetical protein
MITPKQTELLERPEIKKLFDTFGLEIINNPAADLNAAVATKVSNWQNAFKASTGHDLREGLHSGAYSSLEIQPTRQEIDSQP